MEEDTNTRDWNLKPATACCRDTPGRYGIEQSDLPCNPLTCLNEIYDAPRNRHNTQQTLLDSRVSAGSTRSRPQLPGMNLVFIRMGKPSRECQRYIRFRAAIIGLWGARTAASVSTIIAVYVSYRTTEREKSSCGLLRLSHPIFCLQLPQPVASTTGECTLFMRGLMSKAHCCLSGAGVGNSGGAAASNSSSGCARPLVRLRKR